MDRKMNAQLEKFIKEKEMAGEKSFQKIIDEFILKYNQGLLLEPEETDLDKAYTILEKAKQAKTIASARKLAMKAFETSNECFDAKLFLFDIEDSLIKKEIILTESLDFEAKRLMEQNYFNDDNIGHFYQIFETRPYINGLSILGDYYIKIGKYSKAISTIEEILRLNEQDNTGSRYLLMNLFAFLEDKKSLDKIYEKYPYDSLESLFSYFVYYFKINDYDMAKKYLKRINVANKNFIKVFSGKEVNRDVTLKGDYQLGEPSEILMLFNTYNYIFLNTPSLIEFISQEQ